MRANAHQKIKPTNLKRPAYLYIRPSTVRQLLENIEAQSGSTRFARMPSLWVATGPDRYHQFGLRAIGGFGYRSWLSAFDYGGQPRTCWYRARAGSVAACTKLN